jgi:hypothetical protein
MGKRLGWRRLESLVVREERRLVISKLHQKPCTKMSMLQNPTHYEKLDTNPDLSIFPHPPNDFQKPIKLKSTLGNVFFRKESEKPSEEKLVEKPSEEKPIEQPHPKPKPKLIKFHCDYFGRYGHKGEFCFKIKHEETMAKEWANKDRYNPSHCVPKPRMPLPRARQS